jgi:hypothetical protein
MEGEPVRLLEAVVTRKGEFLRKPTCRCELYRLVDGQKGVARSLCTSMCGDR